ncbi:anthranilate phosphoribosyltransferase [Planctomycetales bacterium]|nr:anthranilate phosphoribosyltransferase [Planctomycetales bacterium]GHT36351.1 anthranilate phosphoribosyltransferase [Planctomycetales bacterium]
MSISESVPLTILCRQYTQRLLKRENLTGGEVESFFHTVLSSAETELSVEESIALTGFLIAMSAKGETVQELVGAARGMKAHAGRIQVLGSPVVDIVGTGGDVLHTFNISTTSSFVIAGAGLVVAKHGNRAVSSRCGSADVLEKCGVNLNTPHEIVEEIIAQIGTGFLFAQTFHPAMRRVAKVRKSIGIRTLFNLLGPLTNPAGAGCAVIGVYEPKQTEMFAAALRELGTRRAMVVHGYDGMDEITLTTRSRITELKDGHLRTYDLFPELYFGGELASAEDLRGGGADENAETLKNILTGKIRGAKRNIVLLNSAAALYCADKAETFEEGIKLAERSIDSGAAAEKLQCLVKLSK